MRLNRRCIHGLARLLGFFALVALLVVALNRAIDHGLRRTPISKYGSFNRIMSGQVVADIAVIGSSRAQFHYDPRTIQEVTGRSAYNLGVVGARIDVQLAVLRTYLKRNPKPRLVLQNLEAFIFTTTPPGEINDPGMYAPHLDEEELYRSLLKIDPAVWKWRHIPLYVYAVEDLRFLWARGLLGCIGVWGRDELYRGFNPNYERWNADFDRFRAGFGQPLTYVLEPTAVEMLGTILKTCRDQGIDVILVYSPEFFEAQALVRNREEIFAEFRRLGSVYGAPLWDYSHSPISRQRDYFYTSQHLNAAGAAAFSADLARRLNEINPRGSERQLPAH